MSRAVLTIEVDDAPSDLLGVKEAAAMAVEALGWGRVTCVRVMEPEQLRMAGDAQEPQREETPPPAPSGQAPARRPRTLGAAVDCCFSCGCYQQAPGQDRDGKIYWGVCGRSDQPVYDPKKRCGAWARTVG